jgi:hypothetical protein
MQLQAGNPGDRASAFRWDAAPFRRCLLRNTESAGKLAEQAFLAKIRDGSIEVRHTRDSPEANIVYSS